MVDFVAALTTAKLEASAFAGNGGSIGNGSEKARFHNDVEVLTPVATTETAVATLATLSGDVAIVARVDMAMATPEDQGKSERLQCVMIDVVTVASVSTKKRQVCENHRTDRARHADLRNSMTVYEPQADTNRCAVCGERETAEALLVAVLTSRPGTHHWLHAGSCHDEHMRATRHFVKSELLGLDHSARCLDPSGC